MHARWIAILLVLPLASAGCLGASSEPKAKPSPSPTPEPPAENVTPQAVKGAPLDVQKFKGTVDGAGTPAFSIDLPSSDAGGDIKPKANGSMRFELKFAPSGAANQLHVEIADLGTTDDTTGQPKVLASKEGGPLVVIDVPADRFVGVKELGYRVFYASGSAGQGTEFQAAASVFNGTIPASYTALGPT